MSVQPQLADSTRTSAPPLGANAALAWIAKSMPLIAASTVPLPLESRNLIPISWVIQLMPTTPSALLPDAPIVPETCVPWLWSSIGLQVMAMALKPCVPAGQVIGTPPMVTVNAAGADHMLRPGPDACSRSGVDDGNGVGGGTGRIVRLRGVDVREATPPRALTPCPRSSSPQLPE